MVNVTKLYPTHDATVFHSFGRVISGTCERLLPSIINNGVCMLVLSH